MDLGRMIEQELRLRELEAPSGLPIQQTIERLKNQHALYFDTFYQTPVAIAHIGRDWTWRRMNAACLRLFGSSRESLTRTKLPELLDETGTQRAAASCERPRKTRITAWLDCDGNHAAAPLTGARRVRACRSHCSVNAKSATTSFYSSFTTPTLSNRKNLRAMRVKLNFNRPRNRPREDLRKSYGQLAETAHQLVTTRVDLRAIADNLPVLVAYVDSERRFRFANSTYRDWFGLDSEGILGTPHA